jgi:hypothetical protein
LGIGVQVIFQDVNIVHVIQKITSFKKAWIDFRGVIPLSLCMLSYTIPKLPLQAFSNLSKLIVPTFFTPKHLTPLAFLSPPSLLPHLSTLLYALVFNTIKNKRRRASHKPQVAKCHVYVTYALHIFLSYFSSNEYIRKIQWRSL